MLTEDQRMQMMYAGLTNCFCTERNLTWSRSQLLTVINLAALPLLAGQVPIELRYVVTSVAIVLSIFWLFINQRMRKRINYWLDRLAEMEPREANLLVFRVFTGSKSAIIGKRPWFYAVNLLPWTFLFTWSTALVFTCWPKPFLWLFNFLREKGGIQ